MKKLIILFISILCFSCLKENKQYTEIKNNNANSVSNQMCYEVDMKWWKQIYISGLFYDLNSLDRTENLQELLSKKEEVKLLDINSHKLKKLPEELFLFSNLEALDISNNPFEDLEQLMVDLNKLPKLKLLIMSHCGIERLPDNISLLKNLEGLALDQNKLKVVNENIGELTNLRLLSFRRNKSLKDLPKSIGNLKCLEQLTISGAGFIRIRSEVSNCTNLKSIIANASNIKELPDNIDNLKKLRNLNLVANQIEVLPESMGELEQLEDLSLGSNEINELPKSISNLQNLEAIGLEYNRFKKFPQEVLTLKKLRQLNLHNNNIPTIPIEITNLPKLSLLYVDYEVISDENIRMLREANSLLEVKRHDAMRRAPKEPKRKN